MNLYIFCVTSLLPMGTTQLHYFYYFFGLNHIHSAQHKKHKIIPCDLCTVYYILLISELLSLIWCCTIEHK